VTYPCKATDEIAVWYILKFLDRRAYRIFGQTPISLWSSPARNQCSYWLRYRGVMLVYPKVLNCNRENNFFPFWRSRVATRNTDVFLLSTPTLEGRGKVYVIASSVNATVWQTQQPYLCLSSLITHYSIGKGGGGSIGPLLGFIRLVWGHVFYLFDLK
jgi:hypothetical protein